MVFLTSYSYNNLVCSLRSKIAALYVYSRSSNPSPPFRILMYSLLMFALGGGLLQELQVFSFFLSTSFIIIIVIHDDNNDNKKSEISVELSVNFTHFIQL